MDFKASYLILFSEAWNNPVVYTLILVKYKIWNQKGIYEIVK